MSSERKIVGFDRKLELSWLDATAAQVAHGASADEVRAYLWKMLDGSVSAGSSGFNSDRGKTITVLAHVWSEVPKSLELLRERALKLLQEGGPDERKALHWSMCMATYPFFWDVASTIGRLIAIQDEASLADVRRRLTEQWGDRDITRRASQRIIRSFVAWGVLRDARQRGVYLPSTSRIEVSGASAELVIEALLLGIGRPFPASQALSHPALFPFRIDVSSAELASSPRFVLERQGIDTEMLRLAESAL